MRKWTETEGWEEGEEEDNHWAEKAEGEQVVRDGKMEQENRKLVCEEKRTAMEELKVEKVEKKENDQDMKMEKDLAICRQIICCGGNDW